MSVSAGSGCHEIRLSLLALTTRLINCVWWRARKPVSGSLCRWPTTELWSIWAEFEEIMVLSAQTSCRTETPTTSVLTYHSHGLSKAGSEPFWLVHQVLDSWSVSLVYPCDPDTTLCNGWVISDSVQFFSFSRFRMFPRTGSRKGGGFYDDLCFYEVSLYGDDESKPPRPIVLAFGYIQSN